MVQYLHFRILKFPLIGVSSKNEKPAENSAQLQLLFLEIAHHQDDNPS